ncbi:hypothetical protein GCM10011380_21880 [Sphingomonas metalli]|uniref:RNase H type-1 domain-containing protein n=1 Tax=Sphingomonas metalli TaxID=1779358 RepID=A0A916WTU3_9SPHN|nr:reverse transcriptase-like protein [Sphingomonas metalli]GGB32067.1 hypothetical protein GCM10011380_21880 [Sphingomonas metalli]
MKVFFDGGCRPAGMEWAVVIAGRAQFGDDLGPGTSMAAEWLALLAAIRLADAQGIDDPLFLGDAAAVIQQATGKVRCPSACRPYFEALPRPGSSLRIRYLRRTQNLAGIALDARRL